jgi:hypothetical protein
MEKTSSNKLLLQWVSRLQLEWRPFITYGIAYSFLMLIVPIAVQYLVNDLTMANLRISVFSLIAFIALVICTAMFANYAKYVLLEYTERKIQGFFLRYFDYENRISEQKKRYFFELPNILKSIAGWANDGFDIFLTTFFGFLLLIFYHPLFLLFCGVVIAGLAWVFWIGREAIDTAYTLSTAKYNLFDKISKSAPLKVSYGEWLVAKNNHFNTLKFQTKLIMALQVFIIVGIIIIGVLLVMGHQMSLGQFVSAEIVASGIVYSLSKLNKFLENHYSIIVSLLKLELVKKDIDV